MRPSKRYQSNDKLIEKNKIYPIDEAIELLKGAQKAKFDETVEAHFHLNINPEKTEQQVRGSADLPHGTGRSVRVAVFAKNSDQLAAAKQAGAEVVGGEELIAETLVSKSLAADVAVATPEIMPVLAKLARILGPRGLMPNPKNETVTEEIEKAVNMLKKGKVNFKSDKSGNLHVPIGKVSFESAALKENYEILKNTLDKSKPNGIKGKFIKSITLSSTMGTGIKIA